MSCENRRLTHAFEVLEGLSVGDALGEAMSYNHYRVREKSAVMIIFFTVLESLMLLQECEPSILRAPFRRSRRGRLLRCPALLFQFH